MGKRRKRKRREEAVDPFLVFSEDFNISLAKRRAEKRTRRRLTRNRTRATYGWRQASGSGANPNMVKPMPVEDEPFCPVGQPGTVDIVPVLRERSSNRFTVWMRKPNGSKLYPPKVESGRQLFRKCCQGADIGRYSYCDKETCANCWTRKHFCPKGFTWFIQIEYHPELARIVDPAGVDTHGRRPQGVNLGEDVRSNYKITSTVEKHKGKNQKQIDPAEQARWDREEEERIRHRS